MHTQLPDLSGIQHGVGYDPSPPACILVSTSLVIVVVDTTDAVPANIRAARMIQRVFCIVFSYLGGFAEAGSLRESRVPEFAWKYSHAQLPK